MSQRDPASLPAVVQEQANQKTKYTLTEFEQLAEGNAKNLLLPSFALQWSNLLA